MLRHRTEAEGESTQDGGGEYGHTRIRGLLNRSGSELSEHGPLRVTWKLYGIREYENRSGTQEAGQDTENKQAYTRWTILIHITSHTTSRVRRWAGAEASAPGRAHCPASTAIVGALSSCASRIFFAGACIMSDSYELSGRLPTDSGALDALTDTDDDATGDERDDADADVDASGGVPPLVVLFARAFVGSLT